MQGLLGYSSRALEVRVGEEDRLTEEPTSQRYLANP
jgi:hypothetical protein